MAAIGVVASGISLVGFVDERAIDIVGDAVVPVGSHPGGCGGSVREGTEVSLQRK